MTRRRMIPVTKAKPDKPPKPPPGQSPDPPTGEIEMMPGAYSLNIYRGDSHAWRFVLWADAAKTEAVDLTGTTVKAEIRDRPAGTVIRPITLTVTLPNIVDAYLAASQTAMLPASGRWDLQLTDGTGWVSTVLAGAVKVTGDITDSTGEPAGRAAAPARRSGFQTT